MKECSEPYAKGRSIVEQNAARAVAQLGPEAVLVRIVDPLDDEQYAVRLASRRDR